MQEEEEEEEEEEEGEADPPQGGHTGHDGKAGVPPHPTTTTSSQRLVLIGACSLLLDGDDEQPSLTPQPHILPFRFWPSQKLGYDHRRDLRPGVSRPLPRQRLIPRRQRMIPPTPLN